MAERRKQLSGRLAYYKRYPVDFVSDPRVQAMPPVVENSYRRLLDHAWINGQEEGDLGLDDNDETLARCCRVTTSYFRLRVRPFLIDGPNAVLSRRASDGKLIHWGLAAQFEAALAQSKSDPGSDRQQIRRLRGEISRLRVRLIQLLIERDGDGCRTCGAVGGYHIDHKKPLARGGGNEMGNLQLLCGPCNLSKGSRVMP